MALCQVDDVSNSGIAELRNNGRITRFTEKPINEGTNNSWVNAGIYFMEPITLEKIKNGYSDFGNDIIPFLIESDYVVYGYKMEKKVLAIDTPELLEKTINDL